MLFQSKTRLTINRERKRMKQIKQHANSLKVIVTFLRRDQHFLNAEREEAKRQ